MIQVTKTFLPPLGDYQRHLDNIWQTNQLTNNGAKVLELTKELKSHLKVNNLQLVSNGTIAIQLAIKALDITGEIITTPYSYVATVNAILWEGCIPVFVDVDRDTLCIDPTLIEAAITPKTSAILATHVYGYPCDVDAIQKIADKHGLKVIYDGAHAFGVTYKGKSLVDYGDCTTLSFHATKLFHTGEGGAVVCRTTAVSERVFLMSKFGHIGEENYIDIGINAKMSELHAAMGLCVLPQMAAITERRKSSVEFYDLLLATSTIQRPVATLDFSCNYSYYPAIFSTSKTMQRVRFALEEKDIFARRYFYPSLNTLPFLSNHLTVPCPISESIAERVLCLPLSDEITREDVQTIAKIVKENI